MEQFIPATTIFVSGEKWCNSRICEEMVVVDYLLEPTNVDGVLSPEPIVGDIEETPNPTQGNTKSQPVPINGSSGESGETVTAGEKGNTNTDEKGPIIVGDVKIYGIENLDPNLGYRSKSRLVPTT